MLDFEEILVSRSGGVCTRCGPVAQGFRSAADVIADIQAGDIGENVALVGLRAAAHADIERIVHAAKAAGAVRVRVEATPGMQVDRARVLLRAGIRQLCVTLMGASPKVFTSMGYPEKSPENLAVGIEAFRTVAEELGHRVATFARIPVCRHNVHEVPAAAALAAEAGVDSVVVEPVDEKLDIAGSAPWLAAACDTGMLNAVWVEIVGVPFCFMTGYELHLANVVREYEGVKPPLCGDCAIDPFCDGIASAASAASLAAIRRRPDHEQLADRLRQSRTGLIAL